jgi:hypothetical protein
VLLGLNLHCLALVNSLLDSGEQILNSIICCTCTCIAQDQEKNKINTRQLYQDWQCCNAGLESEPGSLDLRRYIYYVGVSYVPLLIRR